MENRGPRERAEPGRAGTMAGAAARDRGVQTDSRGQGPAPRLSKGNLLTLLSLWMELFPQEQTEQDAQEEVNAVGLVVEKDSKVLGLHSSSAELHAGQAALLHHGGALSESNLYFSRRPCATCLKMLLNAGVSEICFWPGDPEVSMLRGHPSENSTSHEPPGLCVSEEAALDALATDTLKSNSRAHICVPLRPLNPSLAQFVSETSRDGDFMERIVQDEPGLDAALLFNRERVRVLGSLSSRFLVRSPEEHQKVLSLMKLETFCVEPYFSGLRHNMTELVQVLASAVAGVPHYKNYGFYRWSPDISGSRSEPVSGSRSEPVSGSRSELVSGSRSELVCGSRSEPVSGSRSEPVSGSEVVSADEALHCMVQAQLLSFRTEDPKVGVGAVLWARAEPTGRLSFVGCGFNAYPSGSQFNEYPQMDDKQEDRQRRKYRYIVHAEQNALTFRAREIKRSEPTLLFVTKWPCDECVPLIAAAGVSHVFTSDRDQGRDKGDISYLRFQRLQVHKYCWQKRPAPAQQASSHFVNGFVGKHRRQAEAEAEPRSSKKLCSQWPDGAQGE